MFDVTPTLLALQGLPVGRDMDGEVMRDVVDPDYLTARPVDYVDSHTDEAWLAARTDETLQPAGTEERLEQLRNLGYIGD